MQTGEARLTGPITLVQSVGKPLQSFFLFFLLPVFRGDGSMPASPAAREAALMGWSYAPLSMDEVLTNLGLDPHAAQLVVSDITQSAQAAPFYRTPLAEGVGAETATLDLQQGFYGRQWSWRCMFTRHLPKAESVCAGVGRPDRGDVIHPQRRVDLDLDAKPAAQVLVALRTSTPRRHRGKLDRRHHRQGARWHGHQLEPGAERLFGYHASEAIGRNLPERLAEQEEQEKLIQQRVVAGEAIPAFETVRRHRDGRMLDVSISLSPVRDADGVIIGISKTVRDIGEQKAAQAQINELNANLEAQVSARTEELATALRERNVLFQTINEQMLYSVSDRDGRILEVNERLCQASGYTRQELLGQPHSIFNSGVHPAGFWPGYGTAFRMARLGAARSVIGPKMVLYAGLIR